MQISNKNKFTVEIIEVLIIIVTIILTLMAIKYATVVRGYEAVGGEYLVPVLGLSIVLSIETICEDKKIKEGGKKNER